MKKIKTIKQNEIQKIDPSGIIFKLTEFPYQIKKGWNIGQKYSLPRLNGKDSIIFCGMGGSAIAGDIISQLLQNTIHLPFIINRNYDLPAFCSKNTLVIASSYSGNTEETLSAVKSAKEQGCAVICITSGGRLAEQAEFEKWPLITLPAGYPPRTATGYSLGILLALFCEFMNLKTDNIENICKKLDHFRNLWSNPENPDNSALELACRIAGGLPIMYGDGSTMSAVGMRWKAQFNENSKTHAFFQPVPEMNHNEIVGWEKINSLESLYPFYRALFLQSDFDNTSNSFRIETTKNILKDKGFDVIQINARGDHLLEQLLYMIYLGDMTSYYLAILYQVDPKSIVLIDKLKTVLAEAGKKNLKI